jgi:hypothetical protein
MALHAHLQPHSQTLYYALKGIIAVEKTQVYVTPLYGVPPEVLYYKTLRICNVWIM